MIACYCRVSSRRQKTDSQKAEITRWLRAHGISPSRVTWFEDKETGQTVHRVAFEQMEKAIFDGTIKTVIVWKLDRISRRLQDGINLIADWGERGVRVVSITQQIDLSGPGGPDGSQRHVRVGRNRTGVSPRASTRRNRCGQNSRDLSRQAERDHQIKAHPGGPAQKTRIDDPGDRQCTRCQRKDRIPIFDPGAPLLLPALDLSAW